jgi:hypothetical protein
MLVDTKKRLIFGGPHECIVAYILIDVLTLPINLDIERLNYLLIDYLLTYLLTY